jgi:hypothetical protein
VIRILGTSFGFRLASPGSADCPSLSPVAVQVSGYERKLKFSFFVLILNRDLDRGFVHTRRLPSGLSVRVEFQTRGAANRLAGPAVSRYLVYLSHFLSGTSHIYVMIAPCLLYMLLYVEVLERVDIYAQFGLNTLECCNIGRLEGSW